uniref:Nuclear factor related to kappa-B-binding protein n=1 Tax=Ascaris suum TaxID=6253 RepID=F1LE50_ASCSU
MASCSTSAPNVASTTGNVAKQFVRTRAYYQPPSTNIPVPSSNTKQFSRLCLGGEIVQVPSAIVQQEGLFRAVVTKEAFRSLSVEAQTYLKRFLPKYEGAEKEEERILDAVFTADPNFYFGNPLGKVHSKIRCGWFNPERPSDQVQLRDNRRVLYDHYIRYYHISLLKKLLVSRRCLVEQATNRAIHSDGPVNQ